MDDDLFAVFDEKPAVKPAKKRPTADSSGETKAKKPKNAAASSVPAATTSSQDDTDGIVIDKTPSTGKMPRIELQPSQVASEKQPEQTETKEAEQEQEQEGGDTQAVPTTDESGERVLLFPKLAASKESCTHDVALPPGFTGPHPLTVPPPIRTPAKTYKFTLDPFQRASVDALEKGESVLVSAHTSAGKTAVAEYAIAMSLRDHQRVVYTSPIKALSNQKYRELQEEFGDVGLMTGDVTISPNASCLVMTTEILRSMLYRGSEILREVAWVIFDEIHYMRDKERGVVWEETLILLPDKVRFVFLSATIPNALEFAGWIAKLHNQPCHVVYTDYRPTPLQHYIFPEGGEGIHLIVDEKGRFREDNFQKALSGIQAKNDPMAQTLGKTADGKSAKRTAKGPNDVFKIVKMILTRKFDPVIVFSFSKRECEAYALMMAKLDFNQESEKKLIGEIFMNAVDSLSEDDKQLPQIDHILPLLKRGIGIHHSGLLPIIKEVIEILFQEGLLKVLFSTETFSMGLNMPARTVVFTSVRKFDGKAFRWISSGEYIQMSGRAGRRGLDDRGIVIMMVDGEMDPDTAKTMLCGKADPLYSTFHLSYNMLLNLLRVEEINPEYMIIRSFHQFQCDQSKPEMEKAIEDLQAQIKSMEIENEEEISQYYDIKTSLAPLRSAFLAEVTKPSNCARFLQPGRLVKIQEGETTWGWCALAKFTTVNVRGQKGSKYMLDCAVHCVRGTDGVKPRPCQPDEKGDIQVMQFELSNVTGLSSVRMYMPSNLDGKDERASTARALREIHKKFPDGVPMLDPIEDLGIREESFKEIVRKIESLELQLSSNPLHKAVGSSTDTNSAAITSPTLHAQLKLFEEKVEMKAQLSELKKTFREAHSMVLKSDLKCMTRVLRRLGYVTAENVIDTKGRVACEISTADELLLSELIFSGAFNDLNVDQVVSLLSCLIFQEKSEVDKVRDELQAPLRVLQETARRIAKVSEESRMTIDIDEYVKSFSPGMMEVTYQWCKGAKFVDICKLTDIFEGSIIRAMRRLEELLRQMISAAKSIGDASLETKFAEGITKIKRDIVFAASLYL